MFRTIILTVALAAVPAIASASIGQHWGSGISTARARTIALGRVPGGVIASGARLLGPDGRMVYRFGVGRRGAIRIVEVDAMTGALRRPAR